MLKDVETKREIIRGMAVCDWRIFIGVNLKKDIGYRLPSKERKRECHFNDDDGIVHCLGNCL